MKNIPHIIDNRRRVLLDTLIEVSKDHDEISIATGYWDLKGTQALLPCLQQYKKIRLFNNPMSSYKHILLPISRFSGIVVIKNCCSTYGIIPYMEST